MRYLLATMLLLFETYSTMASYKILDWNVANQLRQKPSTTTVEQLEYNLATIYRLTDSSFLIMPLNPFAKCLWTDDKATLNEWIAQSSFPTEEVPNKFYLDHKDQLDDLYGSKDKIKATLLNYLYKDEAATVEMSSERIDEIYVLLKKRKQFDTYRLPFILLAGDYLISKNPELNCRWGMLSTKQLLNPIVTVVLVTETNSELKYFDIRNEIEGKHGYQGMSITEKYIKQFWKRPDEITQVLKLL